MVHAYPPELAEAVRVRWLERPSAGLCALPATSHLEMLLSTAYQATLLRDEMRPVRFRLIVAPPQSFPESAGPPYGLHRMAFEKRRAFTEHELRRLSPAAKYHRSLIGVEVDADGELSIWGLLQSGPLWLDAVRGGRRSLPTLPSDRLVVRATAPGRIAVASGSETLGELKNGQLSSPSSDVFDSEWLGRRFELERAELVTLHAEAARAAPEPWAEIDPYFTRLLSQQMVKRFIATARSENHGATFVVLPPDVPSHVTASILRMKYPFEDSEPRRRYRTLILAAMRVLAEDGARQVSPVGFGAYGASQNPRLSALDEQVFELSHLIAAMAGVDGAVVMTRRFEVLGFGAEIAGDLPDVQTVFRAIDLEGDLREEETVEGVGTRHRAAYRLCSRIHDAVAIVVSQDGSVRFVTWMNGAVTYWDHTALGSPDG